MFNLDQLKLLHSVLNKPELGYPASIAGLVHETNKILVSNIEEQTEREKRQAAASQLRAVGGDKPAA